MIRSIKGIDLAASDVHSCRYFIWGSEHAQALRSLDYRDAGRRNRGRSGRLCIGVAIWMVAARSGRPVGLDRRLGSGRSLGTPRPKLGLPFAPPGVAICTVGKRPKRTLGMARRLGSRRHLGAPGSELGLPVAVVDSGAISVQGSAESAADDRITLVLGLCLTVAGFAS
jgi:hypothetical protein